MRLALLLFPSFLALACSASEPAPDGTPTDASGDGDASRDTSVDSSRDRDADSSLDTGVDSPWDAAESPGTVLDAPPDAPEERDIGNEGSIASIGLVQKGPFIRGSSVQIQELDADLVPTGRTFTVQTTDDLGTFLIPTNVTARYVDVLASGFYYDELTDALSPAQLTLHSISDIAISRSVHVNLLTTLAAARVRALRATGLSVQTASTQASAEVLEALQWIIGGPVDFDSLDISQPGSANGMLLAASILFQKLAAMNNPASAVAELSQLLSFAGADIADNGAWDDRATASKLRCVAPLSINAAALRQNLVARYSSLGAPASIPDFESMMLVPSGCCAPNDQRCSNDTVETCDGTGAWRSTSVCSGGTPYCKNATCQMPCSAGQARCVGQRTEVCDQGGRWQDGPTCGSGSTCIGGSCLMACNPDAPAPPCANGVRDGDETAVDCGGSCPPCADNRTCQTASDCVSKRCSAGTCLAPAASCSDGVKNGNETDIDCGGVDCSACVIGKACAAQGDCLTSFCGSTVCDGGGCGMLDAGDAGGASAACGTFDLGCDGGPCATCQSGTKISLTVTGSGTVCSSTGSTCSASCALHVGPTIGSVALVATPSSGWSFGFWGSPCLGSTKATCFVSSSQPRTVMAQFFNDAAGAVRSDKFFANSKGAFPYAAGRSLAFDGDGNLVMAGTFDGTIDFGGGPLSSSSPASGETAFVAKFTSSGQYVFARAPAGGGRGRAAIDRSGNVLFAGNTEGNTTVDLGGGSIPCPDPSIFVGKYNGTNGNLLWGKCIGPGIRLEAIGVDSTSALVVLGVATSNVDLGGGSIDGGSAPYLVVAKYAGATGAHVWNRAWSATGLTDDGALAIGANDTIAISAAFTGTFQLAGQSLVSLGAHDVAVALLDSLGNRIWARRIGVGLDDNNLAIAVEPDGSVVEVFQPASDLGCGPVPLGATGFARLSASDGIALWNRSIAGPVIANGVSIAPNGDIVLAGVTRDDAAGGYSSTDYGGGPTPGQPGAFVAKYSSAGSYQWQRLYRGNNTLFGAATSLDRTIAVTGSSDGPLAPQNLDAGPEGGVGGGGIFLLQLGP